MAKAQKWYEEQLVGLASDFHHEFALVLARLAETPFIYPAVYRTIRRAVLHRFPFLVWYHVVSVTQAAEALGVSRKTLSAILNGRAGISPEMAVRLSIASATSAESWLNQQTQYDRWHAERRRKELRVAKLAAA